MARCSSRFALGVTLTALLMACSSSTSLDRKDTDGGTGDNSSGGSGGKPSGGGKGGTGGSGGGKDDTRPVGDDLTLLFNPMYSAYDGVHDYKMPAIVQGVQDVEWSCNVGNAVDLTPDTSTGGVLITMRKAGDFKIIARAGSLSGSADLHVTEVAPDVWEIGEQRYNNEIPFPMFEIPDGGFAANDAGFRGFEVPDDLSCRNCHGAGAMALDVEHTPQQTGGYSDEELINIFTNGMKPEGAKFHTPFPAFIYMMYHTWDADEKEQKGIVAYLRSLEPKTQGPLDFQGLMQAFGGGGAR